MTSNNTFDLFTYLGLNANLDDTSGDGEDVADNEEDVPAIDELQTVAPAHFAIQVLLKEPHKLLTNVQTNSLACVTFWGIFKGFFFFLRQL